MTLGLLNPLYDAVSWIMVMFHRGFTALGLDTDGGWAWGMSIVGLVVVIRILLIPLFVKQIKAQRGLQVLQPQIKEIQKRHKDDRERQSQELMKLYRETGTNPLSSCLPIVAQAPIFFALFHVLNNGIAKGKPVGVLTQGEVDSAGNATVFGALISDKFIGAQTLHVQVVTVILILLMTASTFITQRQLMTKNMPAAALEGPFAQQQKILLYVFPLMFAVFGVNFPIGVLIYWLTTNVWSMAQQLYVIRRMPAPGSTAAEELEKRRAEKARKHAPQPASDGQSPAGTPAAPAPPPRRQPTRQPRSKRTGPPPKAKTRKR